MLICDRLVDFNELYTGKKVKKAKTDAVEKLRKQMRLLKSVAEADTTTDAAE
jgi:hypothetical protein